MKCILMNKNMPVVELELVLDEVCGLKAGSNLFMQESISIYDNIAFVVMFLGGKICTAC